MSKHLIHFSPSNRLHHLCITISSISHPTTGSTDGLTPDQIAFLERKKKRAAGEFVEIPNENFCPLCRGTGSACCHKCGGSGVNADDTEGAEDMLFQSGATTVTPLMFRKGWACWLCKGLREIPCGSCGGMGVRGGFDKYATDS